MVHLKNRGLSCPDLMSLPRIFFGPLASAASEAKGYRYAPAPSRYCAGVCRYTR